MQPDSLTFEPLECSLEPELGDYYQDFTGALELVESGYHGGLDEHGVPVVRYGRETETYSAVIAAQYALANITAIRRGADERIPRLCAQLNWLLATQEEDGEFAGCWLMRHANSKYPWLKPPWTSALASGQAISALLRGWELIGDEQLRAAADRAYAGLHSRREQMQLHLDADHELWYEEYPAEPPLHVLNGHVYALLGVLDYARVTGDPQATARWKLACQTTLAHLDGFDLGYWSAYDLLWREPVSLHYHKNIHIPQLRILAALTGEQRFGQTAERWERYHARLVTRLRWQIALRQYGWRSRRRRREAAEPEPARRPETAVNGSDSASSSDPRAIALRPFPYPFRAALAICNDADLLTPSSFRRLHEFLSTGADTEWGTGLSMPVGGTFFMFRSPESPNVFTVFDRLSDTITDDGEFILDCAQRGILDVLHTYGCFTDPSHFTRRLAETAIDALRSRGVAIETWVNHGPPTNIQCIGVHEGWEGDAVDSPAYHADLTIDYGVRWVWTGSEMTDRIGLDAGWAAGSEKRRNATSHVRASRDAGRNLVEPYTLRDGQVVRRLFRYSGLAGGTPVLDDLPAQLSDANLDELVDVGGYAIVYQHLAVRRVRPGSGVQAYGPVDERWFAPRELAALRELARRYHAGAIWVAPTTHLLRYRDAREQLNWATRNTPEGEEIIISFDPAPEASTPIRRNDLAWITFYCDRPDKTRVLLATGSGLEPVALRSNPEDSTGRRSVTLLPGAGTTATR